MPTSRTEISLERAVLDGNLELVEALIRERGEDFNPNEGHDGYGSLLHVALFRRFGPVYGRDRLPMIRLMLQTGADVNVKDWRGQTPLQSCEDPEEAALLLDRGADVNHRDGYGDTVLTSCVNAARYVPPPQGLPLVQLLVRRGADLSARQSSPEGIRSSHANMTSAMIARKPSKNGFCRRDDIADFLEHAQRVELLSLRTLCARGRAAPLVTTIRACLEPLDYDCLSDVLAFADAPPEPALARLFSSECLLPNDVFWKILAFWQP